ncbi:von Willebrand factor A domain-containing protein 7 [Bagarius yarrelli]|uniref:von Willebrand factor A domain-containing protein 7 n=1 Tax=Bagarius yarrelli TaxID=175774 RepID=A0A556TQI9_BAGYA|nr:von Willebrand factor A domain-containing protein 7 [Bagarius yarrelli]
MMGGISLFILLVNYTTLCCGFLPNFWSQVLTLSWNSYTHQYMTENAVFNVTMETIYMMPEYAGGQEQVELGRAFWKSMAEVVSANAEMDFLSSTRSDPVYHFDSERVEESTEMIRNFWKQAVLLTQEKDYREARYILGQLLHGLQDFYSHSNWVEMGQHAEYLHLLHPEEPAVPVASDTTGSMFEEITAARLRALSIIQARARNRKPGPSGTFLLIPFHDPAVGPVLETDDPNEFQQFMENLMALGGGDEPEMCLSAVQLALIHSPPLSEIFVFTDASPKDSHLYSTVKALILEKQSKVTLFRAESEADSSHTFTIDQQVRSVRLQVAGKISRCVLINPKGAHQSLPSETGPLCELNQSDGLYRIKLLLPVEPGQWQLNITSHGPITFNVLGESTLDFFYYFAVEANETHPGLRRVEGSPIAGVPAFLVVAVTGLSTNDEATFSHMILLGSSGDGFQKVLLNSSSSRWSGEELVGFIESVPRKSFSIRLCGTDSRGNELTRVSTEMVQPTHVHIVVLSADHLLPGHHSTVCFEVFNHGPARQFIVTAEEDQGFLTHGKHHRLFIGERGSVREEVRLRTPHSTQAGQTLTLTLTVQARDSPDSNYAVVYLLVLQKEPDMSPPSCFAMHVESDCPPFPYCFLGNWSVYLTVRDKGHSGLASIQLAEGEGTLMLVHDETIGKNANSLTQFPEETYVSPLKQIHEEVSRHQLHRHSWLRQNARGLAKDLIIHGDSPLNVTEKAKRKHITLHYTSDCCFPQAELHVWDGAGNMRNCSLTVRHHRALREKNCAANGISDMLLILALWTSVGLDTIC